jgi:hypothetical protein
MTNDQARKLLGGYATNSLTEAERKALFEAALDDQELFDALQQEEALKELLADPISRNHIQQALAQPLVSSPSRWWSRGWPWVGVAGAVAATVLIVAVIRSNQQPAYPVARVAPPAEVRVQPEPSKPAIVAPAEPKSRPQPRKLPSPPKTRQAENALRQPPAAGLPPPPPRPQSAAAPAAARAQSDTGAVGGFATNFKAAPLLQYSLVKRDATGSYSAPNVPLQPGDAVRLNLSPAAGGYLFLDYLDPAGDWKRLFPAGDQALAVTPNTPQTIPDSPIIVTDTEQQFRLTLVGADTTTVEITIGPGRIR